AARGAPGDVSIRTQRGGPGRVQSSTIREKAAFERCCRRSYKLVQNRQIVVTARSLVPFGRGLAFLPGRRRSHQRRLAARNHRRRAMMRTSGMHGMSGPASRRTLVVVVGLAVAGLVACEVQPKDRARIESVRQTARPGSDGVGGIGRRTGTVGVGQPVPAPDSGGSGVAVVSAEPAAVPGKPDSAGGGRTVTSPGVKVLFSDAERVFRAGDYDEAAA